MCYDVTCFLSAILSRLLQRRVARWLTIWEQQTEVMFQNQSRSISPRVSHPTTVSTHPPPPTTSLPFDSQHFLFIILPVSSLPWFGVFKCWRLVCFVGSSAARLLSKARSTFQPCPIHSRHGSGAARAPRPSGTRGQVQGQHAQGTHRQISTLARQTAANRWVAYLLQYHVWMLSWRCNTTLMYSFNYCEVLRIVREHCCKVESESPSIESNTVSINFKLWVRNEYTST